MASPLTARLGRRFYARPAVDVARALLGQTLVHRLPDTDLCGRIVEVEAYAADIDRSCHAYRGQTARNRSMFGEAGHAYVYRSYGIHCCLNIVTTLSGGAASAVLLRGLEPVSGLDVMRACRPGVPDQALLRGPGNLCRALAIGLELDGEDLLGDRLFIVPAPVPSTPIIVTTRIGITRSVDLPWRFYLRDTPSVSRRDARAERASRCEQHATATADAARLSGER